MTIIGRVLSAHMNLSILSGVRRARNSVLVALLERQGAATAVQLSTRAWLGGWATPMPFLVAPIENLDQTQDRTPMATVKYSRVTIHPPINRANGAYIHRAISTCAMRFWVLLLASLIAGGEALAQSPSDPTPVPPAMMLIDHNKINLATGRVEVAEFLKEFRVTIGQDHGGMAFVGYSSGFTSYNSLTGTLSTEAAPGASGSLVNGFLEMHIQWGERYHNFLVGSTQSSNSQGAAYRDAVMTGPYFEKGAGNASLNCTGSMSQLYGGSVPYAWTGGTCTVTEGDGIRVNFVMGYAHMDETNHIYPPGMLTSVVFPDGETWTYTQSGAVTSVVSSRGFVMNPPISSPPLPTSPGTYPWSSDGPDAVNSSIDYCNPTSGPCAISARASRQTWTGTVTVDSAGNATFTPSSIAINGFGLNVTSSSSTTPPGCGTACSTGFKLVTPLGVTTTYSFTGCQFNCTGTITASKQNTTNYQLYYNLAVANNPPTTTTVTNPDGSVATYSFINGVLMSKTDELGRTQTYQYFSGNNWGASPGTPLVSRIYAPNSPNTNLGYTQYDYTHGALSKITVVPIDGSPSLATQYGITLTCDTTNYKICNKAQYVIDPRGNRTDYAYDPAHGGMVTETLPADANGVRPQKRYSYTQLYPKIMMSNGSLVNSTPVWRLTGISECITATSANPASCVGTAAERVAIFAYNDNNLFLTSMTTASGDGSASATVSYTYDYLGNVTSEKGPRTDVDDTRYTTYDGLRRKVFEVGADPDGAGPLPRLITHHVYDADGNEIRTEYGSGNSTTGADFVVSRFDRMTYDPTTGLLIKKEGVQP